MSEKTDADILNGSPFTVEFNGKGYEWKQRPRAEQRKIRLELSNALPLMSALDQGSSEFEQAGPTMELAYWVMDFCEKYNSEMASDIIDIENYVDDSGAQGLAEVITEIYMPIFNNWLSPYLTGSVKADTGKKKQAKSKSTK
jgi:hypothetical protein